MKLLSDDMFESRLKIFVIASALLLAVCVGRLVQMQLLPESSLQEAIAELKASEQRRSRFVTVRGNILDRKQRVLAHDEPRFFMEVDYSLCRMFDERVRHLVLHESGENADEALQQWRQDFEDANNVVEKLGQFAGSRDIVMQRIDSFNDEIWNLRTYIAWAREGGESNLVARYGLGDVPQSLALADFESKHPDEQERLDLIYDVGELAEMNTFIKVLELVDESARFMAEFEFHEVPGVSIGAEVERIYDYGDVACHSIGWVGPATQTVFTELFKDDPLGSYLDGELCGRDGAEYVCEAVLRGRRGEEVYDIDGNLVRREQARFGTDVTLTLDIKLQQRIEDMLVDPNINPLYDANFAAVVLDVPSGDILALVSLPKYDLNTVRQQYDTVYREDPRKLWLSRAAEKHYPPGSVAKPLIFIAGMESAAATPEKVISCPSHAAPENWPNCWIYRQFNIGHDTLWENNGRNAIRGSCNIYFSHLANMIAPKTLQKWLFSFGYGHTVLPTPLMVEKPESRRGFRQAAGVISSEIVGTKPETLEDVGELKSMELRYFGIGQGSLKVTPLQVANTMAAIARGGVYKSPRLVMGIPGKLDPQVEALDLGISQRTMSVVYEGMHAVVGEPDGTAYTAFAGSGLGGLGVKVYGKTGSTQGPENAWFAGYAVDSAGHEIALSLVIEMGQSGAKDAAPIGREIIRICAEQGYVGVYAE